MSLAFFPRQSSWRRSEHTSVFPQVEEGIKRREVRDERLEALWINWMSVLLPTNFDTGRREQRRIEIRLCSNAAKIGRCAKMLTDVQQTSVAIAFDAERGG